LKGLDLFNCITNFILRQIYCRLHVIFSATAFLVVRRGDVIQARVVLSLGELGLSSILPTSRFNRAGLSFRFSDNV